VRVYQLPPALSLIVLLSAIHSYRAAPYLKEDSLHDNLPLLSPNVWYFTRQIVHFALIAFALGRIQRGLSAKNEIFWHRR
jgi:hypothetical protein